MSYADTDSLHTLDPALCEWCDTNTPATARASVVTSPEYYVDLCTQHAGESASEFTHVNLYSLANRSEYTTLETEASAMTGEWSVAQLEMAARYGAPYPVCGDLTAKKRRAKREIKLALNTYYGRSQSWTGHDPDGNQY